MNFVIATLLLLLLPPAQPIAVLDPRLEGTWIFVKEQSTDLATWRYRVPQLSISRAGDQVTILHQWLEGNQVAQTDSFAIHPGGKPIDIPVQSGRWTGNWYMGVLAKKGTHKTVRGKWLEQDSALRMVSTQTVLISQGEATLTTTWEYRLDQTGVVLTVTEQRSSRPAPVVLVFRRTNTK